MTRRTERIGKVMQHSIGRILLTELSDPRIDTARTSVTRVEVQADLLRAKVYISVLGTDAQQRRAVEALQGAAGRIQALMRADVALRNLPVLDFLTDERFKGTLRTLQIIHEAMTEIHAKEEAAAPGESPEANADAPAPPADETPKTEQP